MILISHRGNTQGSFAFLENQQKYLDSAIRQGYNVELDIWYINNEFYVCPVFNEAIASGAQIKIHNIQKMYGLGTPEDLNMFLEKRYEKNYC